jgi:hypothetical protein
MLLLHDSRISEPTWCTNFNFGSFSLQRDSSGMATQNNELKFRLQSMEQQAQLRDGEQ